MMVQIYHCSVDCEVRDWMATSGEHLRQQLCTCVSGAHTLHRNNQFHPRCSHTKVFTPSSLSVPRVFLKGPPLNSVTEATKNKSVQGQAIFGSPQLPVSSVSCSPEQLKGLISVNSYLFDHLIKTVLAPRLKTLKREIKMAIVKLLISVHYLTPTHDL